MGEFDVTDLVHTVAGTGVELLGADAAGLRLDDQRGALQVVASSSDPDARAL